MTINTQDIRPVRRGIFTRFRGSSIGERQSSVSRAAAQAWLSARWKPHRAESGFNGTTGAESETKALQTGKALGRKIGPLGGWRKRALDITVASVALILALPIMLVTAILIKATMGGPVLFAHRRIGFNGRPFDCYKFRTMVPNAEQVLEEYLARNPQAAESWRAAQKLKHDPRITFLGHVLRKSSIDELPQLVNVLRGEMSCVGPRPIVASELSRYGSLADEYLKTRPGVTGLWQISGRNDIDYKRRVGLDADYVRNWSIWSDLSILAWTALVVMRFDQAS
ncbi:sugar transferase [Ensifer sp. LCM 4579]|uniref:sugar transferase n=1 Tax=Ensifer sp. LCM 4579 TaxID=1848292 RepID=UPI0008DA0E90|nr:sugar transferase [Ensifer sp. LCM 4579]OHV81918.1 exopolysaccharide biosynthesis protein [Ensifer sp. LCM 4579]